MKLTRDIAAVQGLAADLCERNLSSSFTVNVNKTLPLPQLISTEVHRNSQVRIVLTT